MSNTAASRIRALVEAVMEVLGGLTLAAGQWSRSAAFSRLVALLMGFHCVALAFALGYWAIWITTAERPLDDYAPQPFLWPWRNWDDLMGGGGQFVGPGTVDASLVVPLNGAIALVLLTGTVRLLRRGRWARAVAALRGAFVIAFALGLYMSTLPYPAVARVDAPRYTFGVTYRPSELQLWDGAHVYLPPTLVARRSEPNLIVFGTAPRKQMTPTVTFRIDGVPGDWKSLGGSCIAPHASNRTNPPGVFTCRIRPEAERKTAGMLEWLPTSVAPVIVQPPDWRDYFADGESARGVYEGAVGVDAYGGSSFDAVKSGAEEPIASLSLKSENTPGVSNMYLAGLLGSPALSVSGTGGGAQVEPAAAYVLDHDDSYISRELSGEMRQIGKLAMFYGTDQSDESWVASWEVRRVRHDRWLRFWEMFAIGVLGAAIALLVAPGNASRAAGATAGILQTSRQGATTNA